MLGLLVQALIEGSCIIIPVLGGLSILFMPDRVFQLPSILLLVLFTVIEGSYTADSIQATNK